MGIPILIAAVAVEIAFAAFCIMTKSNQPKARSIIRIAAFAGLALFTVLPVIDWSFRHYALAALLLLLAAIGAVSLIRKKEEKRAYRTDRVETYISTGENRKLNVELWYPDSAGGRYPLIVFSHGSLGTRGSNQTLYHELASHGYVVCSIDHTYQCFFTIDQDRHPAFLDMGFVQELMAELTGSDRQFSYTCYQKWMKTRMGDIDFVIDQILSEAKSNDRDRVYKLVDATRIGVMGHSLGGSAALGIGRMRPDVGAVVALEAPFMYDIQGVENGEFVFTDATYPVPVLNVYSDDSWSHLGEWPQYAENHALLSSANATAFNVYISGVGHLTLTDLALESPLLAGLLNEQKSTAKTAYCLKTLNKVCLEFFTCYLKGEGEFTSAGTY